MQTHDEMMMAEALKLARQGIGSVEPNPAVGCLIVKEGQILGKGWHEVFGGPHAEINALADCRKAGADPQGATLYVTLEPCCHQGKTGPCAEAIITAKIAQVIIATMDPATHANGQGIRRLQEAGIRVVTGVHEREAQLLNTPFLQFANTGKTWVVLKWAQSVDGKLAHADALKDRWISGPESRRDAHILRRRTQAILVGINTVIADNPLLTPRPAQGHNPLRIVLDSNLRIPLQCQLMTTANRHPLLILTREEAVDAQHEKAEAMRSRNVEILPYSSKQANANLEVLERELSQRSIQQLLVEGGPRVITSYLETGLAHEVNVYVTAKLLGSAGTADIGKALTGLKRAIALQHVEMTALGSDVRIRGYLS
jgi:diaminohydroxyphosphoribosylaminopyrimidine deaminase / 5-amino-6-(5-phosphoribosylamino)uracil reductase